MRRRIADKFKTWLSNWRIARTAHAVAARVPKSSQPTIVFFNASARLGYLSQNAAFSLLSSWGLRVSGVRVIHFVCNRGMTRCVLGTDPDYPSKLPPCDACIKLSGRLYSEAEVKWFDFKGLEELKRAISLLDLNSLQPFVYRDLPLGELVLPSLRWALRRHHLNDDESTRFFYREYILSAFSLAEEFASFLDSANPKAVVLFNGMMYPEAIARHLALQRGIRAITHEVALLPFSAFFTEGQATAYPLNIPDDFQLSTEQNGQLDEYLSHRFQGEFTMAGIRFWPQMQELDDDFLTKAAMFRQIVPVFTNVIFDTSQPHANSLYPHMFAWLDDILKMIKSHPHTLFVIRAHPDEQRPGTRKQSRESAAQWIHQNGADDLPNVIFVDSGRYLSSYALIQRAHFVMVYNSSIGLEASIMGKPVLCAGAARYTPYTTVFYPSSTLDYFKQAEKFLDAPVVEQPAEFVKEARRVLYFQLFRTTLPFAKYLTAHSRMGYVHIKPFPVEALTPAESPAIQAIYDGVVSGKPFLV